MGAPASARLFSFALEELRRRWAALVPPGRDPRVDTTPFRAFRAALLEEASRAARAPADLSMAWEGTYNGYRLVVAVVPADALPGLDPDRACPLDDDAVAQAPPGGYPLAHVEPGRAEVARDADGATWEAPLGDAAGHFGAPGMRRIP
jgi:hypothetical protein